MYTMENGVKENLMDTEKYSIQIKIFIMKGIFKKVCLPIMEFFLLTILNIVVKLNMVGRKEKGNMLKEMLKFRASLNKIIPI